MGMVAKAKVVVKAKDVLNYADICAGQPIISSVEVENVGDLPLKNVRLSVRAENGEVAQTSFDFDEVQPGCRVSAAAASIRPAAHVVQQVTESYESLIHVELFDGAQLIASATHPIHVQPMDMWAGFAATLALAGFCIPNHPALDALCLRTSELLGERHGSGGLGGYGSSDDQWPAYQAKAAYDALLERGLAYARPPASFEHGQRIRLPHRVLEEGKGTCIDLAFAYASLLEAMRLDPVIVMYDDHAFAGVWLRKTEKSVDAFNRNKEDLVKLTSGPDPAIVLIECTKLTHGSGGSFEAAMKSAAHKLEEKANFEYWMDVRSARLRGIRPLPLFVEEAGRSGAAGAAFPSSVKSPKPDESEVPEMPANSANLASAPSKDEVLADVRVHAAELGFNPITRALMGEPLPAAHQDVPDPEFIDPTGLTAPLVADALQLHAMQYVADGGSCVVEGSPGTGKTQVIVNIAADAAAHGKRVLIVLQNDEQLGVVQARMRAAGMAPFVLQLGKEARATALLQQVDDACSLDKAGVEAVLSEAGFSRNAMTTDARRSVELSRELDAYSEALQRENASELSLREQICGYQRYRSAPDLVFLDGGILESLQSARVLDRVLRLVDDLAQHVRDMGGVRDHPLAGLGGSFKGKTSQEVRLFEQSREEAVKALLGQMRQEGATLQVLADVESFAQDSWVTPSARKRAQALLEEPVAAVRAADDFICQVEGAWKPSLFEQNADALAQRWDAACSGPALQRAEAKREVLKTLQEHAWKRVCAGDVENALGALAFCSGQTQAAIEGFAAVREELDGLLCEELRSLEAIREASDGIYEWNRWLEAQCLAQRCGLGGVVKALQDGHCPEDVAASAKKELFRMMCARSLGADADARRFSGAAFERTISEFAAADESARTCGARALVEIRARSAKETLARKDLDEQVKAFKIALRSHGRGKKPRDLFDAFPDVLLGACPCVLSTPLAAARHMGWSVKFDLVVIDEASQLETPRAIGVLERAAQAVVVGDPQQLPPTTFFSQGASLEDVGIAARGDSILDDCVILGLPKVQLRWHYRSRHESLIAFSNEQFYRNRLLTFPSVDDRSSAVKLCRVEGPYDGGGINRAEAEAIVQEVKRRFARRVELGEDSGASSDVKGCGIGVITFNVKQKALVSNLLKEEFAQDAQFAAWAQEGLESLFVRNLETVQGDERDVILLSLTYARAADGKLSLNFGPVNQAGGERRLNVAFTRARCEMLVFTALSSGEIPVSDTTSAGVRAMRDFLAYAEGLQPARCPECSAAPVPDDAIAVRLCELLEERGYRTQRNVGTSHMKVDVAVVDPRDPGRYLAGILLDGESYRASRSTRDRELGRVEQLRSLGWSIRHVWAVDFLFDERKCANRVIEFLNGLAA